MGEGRDTDIGVSDLFRVGNVAHGHAMRCGHGSMLPSYMASASPPSVIRDSVQHSSLRCRVAGMCCGGTAGWTVAGCLVRTSGSERGIPQWERRTGSLITRWGRCGGECSRRGMAAWPRMGAAGSRRFGGAGRGLDRCGGPVRVKTTTNNSVRSRKKGSETARESTGAAETSRGPARFGGEPRATLRPVYPLTHPTQFANSP